MLKPFFEITVSLYNLWFFSGIFLLLNMGFILLIPKYNIGKFIHVPSLKYYTGINKITYYLIFLISVFLPLKIGTIEFYVGLSLFIVGILFYATALFSFAISEYHLPVTGGIYRFSRHPIYVSFLIIISGMILMTFSGFLFIIAFLQFVFYSYRRRKNMRKAIRRSLFYL